MQILQLDPGLGQNRLRQAALLFQQGRQKMLDVYLLLASLRGEGLGAPDALLEFFRETIEVHKLLRLMLASNGKIPY